MKVYFNKPKDHWISPYTILEKVFFWREIEYEEPLIDKLANVLTPISEGIKVILDFVHPKIEYVKIDYWDVWSMDMTLSPIILPMLKQLKKVKHGSGLVDLNDVPEHLRSTQTENYDSQLTFDFYENPDEPVVGADVHTRWDWVLDEMIWAFEQLNDDDNEKQFTTGEYDLVFEKCEEDIRLSRMVEGPKHTAVTDYVSLQNHQKRIQNGLRLFGVYYNNLWD